MTPANQVRANKSAAFRIALVSLCLLIGFSAITVQLLRLGWSASSTPRLSIAAPISESYSRPHILDRDGNILARDILLPSITANPSKVLDRDEVVETLRPVLPPADAKRLAKNLADRSRQFIWVTRKISTARAETIHNFGLPGIGYRWETKRTYPAGRLAGHFIGGVDRNSAGIRGLERFMDTEIGLRMARTASGDPRPPLRLTLSMAVQHGLEQELQKAMQTFRATGAAGLVMDVKTGEIAAAASLPFVDPAFPSTWFKKGPINRLTDGIYELGSIFKLVTAAMGLELKLVTPETTLDVGTPIEVGRFVIEGRGAPGARASVHDIIVRSINTGTGRIALEAGADHQRAFLARLGLLKPMRTQAGPLTPPKLPDPWGEAAVITLSYGHGIAVAPLQFAAAAATLVNGGYVVEPTFLPRPPLPPEARKRVISAETSAAIRKMMADVVGAPSGTAKAAAVPAYRLGGKTGTADRADPKRGYDGRSVITSFVGAFPIEAPQYLVMVTLFEPQPAGPRQSRQAGTNAAPTAAAVVRRVAPILGVIPQ